VERSKHGHCSDGRATLDDLYREEGKAELIGGRIVRFMASGDLPSAIAGEIFVSLRQHTRTTQQGKAYPDGVGYAVPELTSSRESFSPDASYYARPLPPNRMRFIEGPPTFAVEVRSENDYGGAAEAEMAARRADYFEAGTAVVWDVDPQAETITAHRPPPWPGDAAGVSPRRLRPRRARCAGLAHSGR
jgi:Uma2 family endonuclease